MEIGRPSESEGDRLCRSSPAVDEESMLGLRIEVESGGRKTRGVEIDIEPPTPAISTACFNSSLNWIAEDCRWAGSFSRARITTCARGSGTSGEISLNGRGEACN